MPVSTQNFSSKPFLTIVQGKLRQKVEEGTPGAVYRTGQTPSGATYSKWEIVFPGWSGIILDIRVFENEFGETCNIEMDDVIISMPTDSRYFSDIIKKLAGADIQKEVTISPYDFEDKEGKRRSGVTVIQDEKKLSDHFANWENGRPTYKEGFPQPDEKMSKDDWKIYFLSVKKFLKNWIETHSINNLGATTIPGFEGTQESLDSLTLNRDAKFEGSIDQIPY